MILVYYLFAVNTFAFILYGLDKSYARKNKRRIPEATLLFLAWIGGSIGAFLGMHIFRHKTQKRKFSIPVPALAVLEVIICIFCLYQNYYLVTTEYQADLGLENDITIVQVSDLHNQFFGPGQSFLLSEIEKQNPDIIVVTGDAVDLTHTSYGIAKDFFAGAVKIAPVYYITGNHEVYLKGEKLDKFFPRSYNMGIRREVYQELGGFSKMRFGEDIDFSYRIVEAGYKTALIPEAWVWHKRRTDFRKFFRQVYNSGIARINLEKRHPGTLKLVHLLPTVFTVGVIGLLMLFLCGLALFFFSPDHMSAAFGFAVCELSLIPIILYSILLFLDSSIRNLNPWVGLLSIPAAFTQLIGYGLGFLESWWKRCILKQDEFTAFEKNFYK